MHSAPVNETHAAAARAPAPAAPGGAAVGGPGAAPLSPRARSGSPLQREAWRITAGVLAALAVLLLVGAGWVFRRSYAALEMQSADERASRVQRALAVEVDTLERSARDYAEWNDTYDFITDSGRPYLANNMIESVFTNLRLQAFLLFDPAGNLHAGRTFRGEAGVSRDGVEELAGALRAVARRSASGQTTKGIIRLPGRLVLFACLPVMHDNGAGPPNGALAFARDLDEEVVARLGRLVNMDLELRPPGPADAPAPANPASVSPEAFRTVAQSGSTMVIDTAMECYDGRDAGSIRIIFPRAIHQQAIRAGAIFVAVVVIMVVVAGVLIGWLLRTRVIARLVKLQAGVQQVEASANLEARLPVEGKDEIAELALGINRMLSAFARSESQRRDALRQRELIDAQLQQAQKMEAIGTLAGGLAHDFNNLLMAIMGSVGLLRHLTPVGDPAREHLARIEKASRHAADIVRQMLTFSRRESSTPGNVHLGEITGEALTLLRAGVPRSIEFQYRNEAVDDLVNADPTQLHQVLYNLATNASHAMAAGKGLLTVTIAEVTLPDPSRAETAAMPPGGYLCLTMADTGCGIAPENLGRIFEPFFTTKPVGVGTGLGLSVVHGIIAAHRGSIGVESTVGQGTRFFIWLPKAIGPAAPAPPAPAATGWHILVVDDDQLVRETLQIGLERSGFRVTTAANGLEGIRLIGDQRDIEAVVTDQMMPGFSGLEFGEKVIALRPGLPVIILTGFLSAVDEVMVRSRGFELMGKPVSLDDLARALLRRLARPPA